MPNKFFILKPFLEQVLLPIKKELINEHLSKDKAFFNKYFPQQSPDLSHQQVIFAYTQELINGNSELGEMVVLLWVKKNYAIYSFFSKWFVQLYNTKGQEDSLYFVEEAISKFGYLPVYFFLILNDLATEEIVLLIQKRADDQIKENRATDIYAC